MEDMGASFLGMKAVVVPCSSGQVTIFIVKCLLASSSVAAVNWVLLNMLMICQIILLIRRDTNQMIRQKIMEVVVI